MVTQIVTMFTRENKILEEQYWMYRANMINSSLVLLKIHKSFRKQFIS